MAAFSRRTRSILAAVVAFFVLLGLMELYLWRPVGPRTLRGWVAWVAIGLPAWLLLEWIGDVTLNSRWFDRLGRFGRIALGVPVFLVFISLTGALIWIGARIFELIWPSAAI